METKDFPLKRVSFTVRIGAYFSGLFMVAIGVFIVLWYFGLPQLGIEGAGKQFEAEAIRNMMVAANYRLALISDNIQERRGNLLMIALNKMLTKSLEETNQANNLQFKQFFNNFLRAYPDRYQRLIIVDPKDFRILASSDESDVGQTFHDSELIIRARQPGITELIEQITLPSNKSALTVVRQILALDAEGYPGGKLVGILIAFLDSQQFFLETLLIDSPIAIINGHAAFFDPTGRLLATSGDTHFGDSDYKLNPQVAEGFEGVIQETDAKGNEIIVVYRHLQLSGTQGFTLVHYWSKDEALAAVKKHAKNLIFVGILMTLISFTFIILVSRRLTGPLKSLTLVARQLGLGDLSVRTSYFQAESTEIATLSAAFNGMADYIQKSHLTLEAKVLERTAELEQRNRDLQKEIEEHGRTEESLKKSERQLKLVTDSLPAYVAYVGMDDLRYRFVNLRYEESFKIPHNRIIGSHIGDVIGQSNYEVALKYLDIVRKGKAASYENRFITAGTERWIEVNYVPDINDAGNVEAVVVLSFDITERKQAEEKIRLLNTDLEIRVLKRTSELATANSQLEAANIQLESANSQLEATNKELEAFSYSVSHDLRAPLRSIDGWSLALFEDFEDVIGEEGKTYIERIRKESQRMGQLIDSLLKLSRITKSELFINQVNISELAKKVAEKLKESYPENINEPYPKNIKESSSESTVEFIIEPDLTVYADSGMMDIVLTNLIGNAFKFTGKTPTARIEFGKLPETRPSEKGLPENSLRNSAIKSESDGKQIFFVKDNGKGFDMKYSGKLFGAFQRLHKESEFPGTGIGLATVQRIIHKHGGRVWAEGEVNKGATFYFTL